jgi:sporulation-control protein spo0M
VNIKHLKTFAAKLRGTLKISVLMAAQSVPFTVHIQGGYNEKLQEVTQDLSQLNPWSEEKDDQSSKGDTLYKLCWY